MKFCDKHWQQLRDAIEARGLSHMIHQGGEAAAKAYRAMADGTGTKVDYDPLLDAHNMLVAQAIKCGGLYLMTQDENGNDYCPMCEVDKYGEQSGHSADKWINDCCDAILKMCQEEGLTVPKQ